MKNLTRSLAIVLCTFALTQTAKASLLEGEKIQCFGLNNSASLTENSQIKTMLLKLTTKSIPELNNSLQTQLEVLLTLKDKPQEKLRQFFVCEEDQGEIFCRADCDQGGVKVIAYKNKNLQLESHDYGFYVESGCSGDYEEAEELRRTLISTSEFKNRKINLREIPLIICKEVSN